VGSLPSPPRSNSSVVGRRGGDKVMKDKDKDKDKETRQSIQAKWLQVFTTPFLVLCNLTPFPENK